MMRIWTRWRRACTCRSLWPVIMSLVHLLMVLFIQSLVWPEVVVTPRHSSLEVKPITDSEIQGLRESARRMFYFGYDNYMRHAFPADELDPIHCTGRGADKANMYVISGLCFRSTFKSRVHTANFSAGKLCYVMSICPRLGSAAKSAKKSAVWTWLNEVGDSYHHFEAMHEYH